MNEGMMKMLLSAMGFKADDVKTQIEKFMRGVSEMEARQMRIEQKLDMIISSLAPVYHNKDDVRLPNSLNGTHV